MLADKDITHDDYLQLMDLIMESTIASEREQCEFHLRLLDKFKKYSSNIYIEVTKKLLDSCAGYASIFGIFFGFV